MDSFGRRVPPTVKPTNYVAGLGRGAVGFTTRSDIGPAREAANTAPGGGLQGMQGPGAMPPPPPMPGMQGLGPGQHGPERTDYGQAPEGYVAGMGRGMGAHPQLGPARASGSTTP